MVERNCVTIQKDSSADWEDSMNHKSDCATNNMLAMLAGECECGFSDLKEIVKKSCDTCDDYGFCGNIPGLTFHVNDGRPSRAGRVHDTDKINRT